VSVRLREGITLKKRLQRVRGLPVGKNGKNKDGEPYLGTKAEGRPLREERKKEIENGRRGRKGTKIPSFQKTNIEEKDVVGLVGAQL